MCFLPCRADALLRLPPKNSLRYPVRTKPGQRGTLSGSGDSAGKCTCVATNWPVFMLLLIFYLNNVIIDRLWFVNSVKVSSALKSRGTIIYQGKFHMRVGRLQRGILLCQGTLRRFFLFLELKPGQAGWSDYTYKCENNLIFITFHCQAFFPGSCHYFAVPRPGGPPVLPCPTPCRCYQ